MNKFDKRELEPDGSGSIVENVEAIKRLAVEMVTDPPCRICHDGYVCWWHREGFDQSEIAA